MDSFEKNEQHFLAQIDTTGGPDACHEWRGTRSGGGYGVSHTYSRAGRVLQAHRRAWQIVHGPVPAGCFVLQMCNNRLCCNLAHLKMGARTLKSAGHFLSKVDQSGGPNACHPWLGFLWENGYGCVGYAGRTMTTHRRAWEITHGPIPDGLSVLHRCDNRRCCNPAHLFLGTQTDNQADMRTKGRQWRGSLTPEQVRDLRRRYAAGGIILKQLAQPLGMSNSNVCAIIRRRSYRWVDDG